MVAAIKWLELRPVIAPQIFAHIREAPLIGRRLTFLCRSENAEAPAYREVVFCGLLYYGHRVYLVTGPACPD